ncbi:hypothetical protein Rhopal_001575-T1 [Rhodotorula paludigena]|uniref:Ubiquitinyl hydrolase 1 n=1 Tax=Rhodotorula paludigena TaxID=86838 RepID=A0AAV5GH72_9BASI|nr:hypothetical protein Rhopal_001575-T1 [Rhodotorula paludigena]
MPPKKGPKRTLAPSIHLDLAAHLDALASTDRLPARLPADALARAYGLAQPRDRDHPVKKLHAACPSRWQNPHSDDNPVASSSRASDDAKPQPEVIVLGSDGDDDAQLKPRALKKLKRGKGKAKDEDQEPADKPCTSDNCQNNPRCLNWLGQDKWEKSDKALKDFRKAAGLPLDPSNDRDPDIPVGLKNLGATCYANSFLQVWFRDAKFREGVYSCLPPSTGNVEASPVFQLQVLFAFLQQSQQAVYDPDPLVDALKIKKTEQQDAQEFSKLFLSLLDHEFKKQGKRAEAEGLDGRMGRIVQDQFEGKMVYGTQCLTCKTKSERDETFLEIPINLAKNCKLEEQVMRQFAHERLEGDNQYYCDNCDGKRDAKRYSRIETLPPVLHFSLLRFVFSQKDFSRSKSQHQISYPLELDMGPFLPRPPDHDRKRGVCMYDLKGVLMHKGTSAHHGHYVAQVYDESRAKWFLFDDETVTPIDHLNERTTYDEKDDDDEPVKSKKRDPAGFTRDEKGGVLPKSKDAYMLVYTRRDHTERNAASGPIASTSSASTPAATGTEPAPPALALSTVERLDEQYRAELAAYRERADAVEQEFERAREAKRGVYRVWDVVEEDEEAFLVDKKALARWVEDGLKKPQPKSGKGKGKQEEEEVERSDDMDVDGAKKAEGEDVEMANGAATCDEAIDGTNTPASPDVSRSAKPADAETPTPAVASTSNGNGGAPSEPDDLPPPSELRNGRGTSSSTSPPAPTNKAEQHSPTPAASAAHEDEPIKVISNASVTCVHGMADPRKAEQMKRVSQMGVMALRELGVTIEPELMTGRDFCRECVAGIAADLHYATQHPKDTAEFSAADNLRDANDTMISREWIRDWKKPRPKMHKTGAFSDPSPSDEPYIRDIAIEVLQRVFPRWKPVRPDPCAICEGQHELQAGELEMLKTKQKDEKRLLKSIQGESTQMRLTGMRLPLTSDDESHFVIPKVWTRKWNKWVKGNVAHTDNPRPDPLDNGILTCEHGLLCVDLALEVSNPRRIDICTAKEWQVLVKNYDASPVINIWEDRKTKEPHSAPPVCFECLEKQRHDFSQAELGVLVLDKTDFDEDGKRKPASAASPEVSMHAPNGSTNGPTGARSSTRIKQKSTVAFAKQLKYISMNKDDQVKDLKAKIEEVVKIPIGAQRLFFRSEELDDASVSVEELGLASGDRIEVFGVDVHVDLDQLDDSVDVGKPKRGGKRAREEGFGGTGLFGFELEDVSAENVEAIKRAMAGDSDDEIAIVNGPASSSAGSSKKRRTSGSAPANAMDEEDKVACPHCTFINAEGMNVCEICEQPLSSS